MQKIYFLIFLVSMISFVQAQNNAAIKGKVFDSELKPLEKATVSLVSEQDSLVVTYALTNDKGEFELVRIPTNKELTFFISHVNSSAFQKKINLKPNEKLKMDSIIMKGNSIEEIEITAVPPIRLNGDTLEYKASYFKTRPNANVEELISLLPGLQVNADGTIYYQGRQVQSVRVNNKDFFAQDLKIATRNLDASLIDVVQIIKDKGESKREILDDSQLPIVLNLKMKREFLKANFGKLFGGAATRDRYEAGALINTFRDTLQVSFIGFANNINRQGFDYSELNEHGGMNRAENQNYASYGTNGLMNQISAGVNINYDIEKKLKVNLMYNYVQHDYYYDSRNEVNSFYNEIAEQLSNTDNSNNSRFTHELRGFLRYHIDTTSQVTFSPSLSGNRGKSTSNANGESWRNNLQKVTQGEYQNEDSKKGFNYGHNLYAEKKFKNKWLISINQGISNENSGYYDASNSISRFYLLNDSVFHQVRQQNSNTSTFTLSHKVNLQVPLGKKVNFDVFGHQNLNEETSTEDILNSINSDILQSRNDVANNKGLLNKNYIVGTKWNLKIIKNLPISFGLKWGSFTNHFDYYQKLENRNTQESHWLPDVNLSYKGLNFNYYKELETPRFYSIVTVKSDLTPNYLRMASPFFENNLKENYRVYYNKFFTKSKINLHLSGGFSKNSNSIAHSSTYDIQTSFSSGQFYQAGPTEVKNFYVSFSKTIFQNKNWNLNFNSFGYGILQDTYSKVNTEENIASGFYSNFNNTMTLTYKNAFTFTPMFEFNSNNTKFKFDSENFKDMNNNSKQYGATLLLNNIKNFRLESSYTIKNQVVGINNQRQNLHIVNASIYYPILKKGELKLSAFDILNQNVSNYFGTSSNSTYFNSTTTLRQYFLLGMVYKFLKTENK